MRWRCGADQRRDCRERERCSAPRIGTKVRDRQKRIYVKKCESCKQEMKGGTVVRHSKSDASTTIFQQLFAMGTEQAQQQIAFGKSALRTLRHSVSQATCGRRRQGVASRGCPAGSVFDPAGFQGAAGEGDEGDINSPRGRPFRSRSRTPADSPHWQQQ